MFLITLERDNVIILSECQSELWGGNCKIKPRGLFFIHHPHALDPVLVLQNAVFKINILLEILKITVALGNVFNVQIHLTHLSGAMGKLQIKKIHKISTHQCLRETSHLGRPFFFLRTLTQIAYFSPLI